MKEKIIIFDSSTLISFAMNGLLPVLKSLRENFNGKFIITSDVKKEIIETPLDIKRFELEALQIKELYNEKVLEHSSVLGIKDSEIEKETKKVLEIANNTFFSKGKEIKIINFGEASCLALSSILNRKNIQNVVSVDEKTTRMLGEKPENLRELLQKKLHTKIEGKTGNYKEFKDIKFLRSSELIYVAYKKGLIKIKDHLLLDALLYAVKFKGCAISDEEIAEIKKLR